MKKQNLLHFIECLLLFPLFLFLAFFMRLQNDLFFTVCWLFPAIAAVTQLIYSYVVADSEQSHRCKLLALDLSDLIFVHLLVQVGCSIAFLTVRNYSDCSLWTALTTFSVILLLALSIAVIPAPAGDPPPAPTNERDEVSPKKLLYYSNYLAKLCKKCEYAPLTAQMEQIGSWLIRLDPAFSVQLQALENDISAKCVKVENALLTGDHTKLPLLAREMETTLQHIEKRVGDYRYTLTDEGFYHEDDEIAMAQIDRLLDKLGLEYEEDLPTANQPFTDEFFYQKAMKFASMQYRSLLEGYNEQIIRRLAEEEEERINRRKQRLRRWVQACHGLSVVLMIVCVALPALWHWSIRPNGLTYTIEKDTGYAVITGYNPFYGEDLTIPATINGQKIIAVGDNALNGGTLTSLTLSEGVERLDYQSIRDNPSLSVLRLPKSLKTVNSYATYNLPALTVYYAGTKEEWAKVKIDGTGNANNRLLTAEMHYGN